MFLINLNAEIACILHSENRATSQIWKVLPNMVSSPDLGGKSGGVLSMRMQVILDSSFARPGSAPIWGGKKVEFRDWTTLARDDACDVMFDSFKPAQRPQRPRLE